MTGGELGARVRAGELDLALEVALSQPSASVIEACDSVELDAHAEQYSAFLLRWVERLPEGEQLEAADWLAGQFVTSLVHVEGSYGHGARVVLRAQARAAHRLARSMRDFWALTHGPDAEVQESVAHRLTTYAGLLEAMNFSEEPERRCPGGDRP